MEIYVAAVVLVVFVLIWKVLMAKRLPPGPWGLPIVGYIPFLSKKPHLDLQDLSRKYGNVFSIRLGSQYIVVLNDFESTKEAFIQDSFMGRPPDFAFEVSDETRATGALLGLPWKDQRRFTLHRLRDLGFGKSTMEGHITEEISELLDSFEEKGGEPFNMRDDLGSSLSNNIGALVFGKRFGRDDPNRERIDRGVKDATKAAGQVVWHLFFPWLKKLCKFLGIGNVDLMAELSKGFKDFIMEEINEHERTFDPENIRDFIDAYLVKIKEKKDPAFNKGTLQDVVGAFFGAGSETVRTSVEWLVLVLASNRDYQRRIQDEIDSVIGRDRPPTYTDSKDMPYAQAFMLEMLRWRTLLPLNLLHYTLEDAELNGYFIPKDTQVLANLWAIHHHTKSWGRDAEQFRPERFLTDDGKAVKKIDHNIPFSIGKRACPGEPLARIEVFLYFISILQRFDISLPKGQVADFEGDFALSLTPKPQDFILTKRK